MFAGREKHENLPYSELREDVSREDIAAAFRAAMIGHFRSHVPGTNINESTLLASDYLNHFHELVMLLEAMASEPDSFAGDLLAWRPLTYEEHFHSSGFRDRSLAIAAYRQAPQQVRAQFDQAVERLHQEAVRRVGEIATLFESQRQEDIAKASTDAAIRLRTLIAEADAIATGEPALARAEKGKAAAQAAADALFSLP